MKLSFFRASFFSVFLSANAFSGDIVNGAKIISIASSNWNEKAFAVQLEGGVGPCANKFITFPAAYSQSVVAYAMSQGMAMNAYLHGKKVRVHNYGDRKFRDNNICTGGSFIQLSD